MVIPFSVVEERELFRVAFKCLNVSDQSYALIVSARS